MKVHIDINVFMDVLSKRSGWTESLATIKVLKPSKIKGNISALTTAILYFCVCVPSEKCKRGQNAN